MGLTQLAPPPRAADPDARDVMSRVHGLTTALESASAARVGDDLAWDDVRARLHVAGLLGLTIPVAWGGLGAPASVLLDATRVIARVDPSIAKAFASHHLVLATIRLLGNAAQYERAAREVVEHGSVFANALDPKETRARLVTQGNRYAIDGAKRIHRGAEDADAFVVAAIDRTERLVVAVLPTTREGVSFRGGEVVLEQVIAHPEEILGAPGTSGGVAAGLRPSYAHAITAHIELGLAEGAARGVRTSARRSDGATARDDARETLRRHRAGEVHVAIEAASALCVRAAQVLDLSLSRARALTEDESVETALRISTAKVATSRAVHCASESLLASIDAQAGSSEGDARRLASRLRSQTFAEPIDVALVELGAHALYAADGRG